MMRHVLILAHDRSSSSRAVTIALDRHLSRGENVEIVQDRRGAALEAPAARWPTGQERRRAGALADQLRTQGYAMLSREVAPPVEAAPSPAPTPPRAPELALPTLSDLTPPRMPPRSFFEHRRVVHVNRPRISPDDQQALREDVLGDWAEDPSGREDFDRPRRRGGLVAVLVVVVALGAGLGFFSAPARDRLAGLLTPSPLPTETTTPADTATPPGPVAEEPARIPARPPALTPPTRLPSAPSPATPPAARLPSAPSPATPPAARLPSAPSPATPPLARPSPTVPSRVTARDVAPAEPDAPAPSAPLSLPPRRAETLAADQPPGPAPQSARTQRLPEFPGLPRVELSRAPGADGTTFTVRLTDPRGRPLPAAQVWLRQKSTDGFVHETPLEPVPPAGSYRGAVPGAATRADALSVRVVLGDKRMEMPVTE